MGLVDLREEVRWLRENYQASQQRACGLMAIAVSNFHYQSTRSDQALRERLVELARRKPRFGYRHLHVLLRGSGERVNHKRVFRVYRKAQEARARGFAASGFYGGQPGMGRGLCARRDGQRTSDPRAERGG